MFFFFILNWWNQIPLEEKGFYISNLMPQKDNLMVCYKNVDESLPFDIRTHIRVLKIIHIFGSTIACLFECKKQPRKEILKMCIEWKKRKEFALEIFFLLLNSHKRILFSLVSERIRSIMNQKRRIVSFCDKPRILNMIQMKGP